jgi:hypothetical protein
MIVELSDRSVITDKQNVELQEGLATLYCLGFVTHLDAPRRLRTTAFCRAMTFPKGTLARADNCRFAVVEHSDYEYHAKH